MTTKEWTSHQSIDLPPKIMNKIKKMGMDKWLDAAVFHRGLWLNLKMTPNGDMPPVVIACRGGKEIAVITCNQIDKHQALHAASIARLGMAADEIVLFLDGHVPTKKTVKEMTGWDVEKFQKRFPSGSMQKMCDESHACEAGVITDCMMIHSCTPHGIKCVVISYDYHPIDGSNFKWTEEHILCMDSNDKNCELRGLIPESMKEIMSNPTIFDEKNAAGIAKSLGLNEEQMFFHGIRGAIRALSTAGYALMVKDERYIPDDLNLSAQRSS